MLCMIIFPVSPWAARIFIVANFHERMIWTDEIKESIEKNLGDIDKDDFYLGTKNESDARRQPHPFANTKF